MAGVPKGSFDKRYAWNHGLYHQLRTQKISHSWMISLVQGFVGHCQVSEDLQLVLISRRRWMMGGPRAFARGIDESANAANFVETEQLLIH